MALKTCWFFLFCSFRLLPGGGGVEGLSAGGGDHSPGLQVGSGYTGLTVDVSFRLQVVYYDAPTL